MYSKIARFGQDVANLLDNLPQRRGCVLVKDFFLYDGDTNGELTEDIKNCVQRAHRAKGPRSKKSRQWSPLADSYLPKELTDISHSRETRHHKMI